MIANPATELKRQDYLRRALLCMILEQYGGNAYRVQMMAFSGITANDVEQLIDGGYLGRGEHSSSLGYMVTERGLRAALEIICDCCGNEAELSKTNKPKTKGLPLREWFAWCEDCQCGTSIKQLATDSYNHWLRKLADLPKRELKPIAIEQGEDGAL